MGSIHFGFNSIIIGDKFYAYNIVMKRILLLIIFSLFAIEVPTAFMPIVILPVKAPANAYDRLIDAVVYIESRGNNYAYNVKENAIGAFQIRESRLREYNRLTGKNYSHQDCYDYEVSKEIFLYYCRGRDYETVARAWAGGEGGKNKPITEKYWNLVKSKL